METKSTVPFLEIGVDHTYSFTCFSSITETRPLGDLTLFACADHDDLSVECPASHPHVRIITADFGRQEGKSEMALLCKINVYFEVLKLEPIHSMQYDLSTKVMLILSLKRYLSSISDIYEMFAILKEN